MPEVATNPAVLAAQEAWSQVQACLDQRSSFIFEAGAGAGKTYSLIEALRYLVKRDGMELIKNHQRVACITYTNIATTEIETRTDRHPAIYSSTIHAFCWSLIKGFQAYLRKEIQNIAGWPERLEEWAQSTKAQTAEDLDGIEAAVNANSPTQDSRQLDAIESRNIEYSFGYPKADKHSLSLGHNDVLILAAKLLENEKFRRVLVSRFPVIFVDEYQDTDSVIFEALKAHVIGVGGGPLIGFFGDHWQKIYGSGCGKIEHPKLTPIGKKANFRSVATIVNCLNRIRPELPQAVADTDSKGSVCVFHTNKWRGERRKGNHWIGDLPQDDARSYFHETVKILTSAGWDFSPEISKILMLTHNAIASEQGYKELLDAFKYRDSVIKKEDPHMLFLADTVEPACRAFIDKRYGEMFEALGGDIQVIQSHADKVVWADHLNSLLKLRGTGTIGAMMGHIRGGNLFPLPGEVDRREKALEKRPLNISPDESEEIESLRALHAVPYKQVVALADFIAEKTPFSTKHGVKGAEFENVLVVFGRGWNEYNFGQFLEWASLKKVPDDRATAFERNRNLFYVACSRPKKRLALLFTQQLSDKALEILSSWFGSGAIQAMPHI